MEMVDFQAVCCLALGEAQLMVGHLEEAHTLAEGALALAGAHQERGHGAYTLHLLGDIAAHRDPSGIEEAEAYYRQALALAEEPGMRPLRAHCHLGLGKLYTTMLLLGDLLLRGWHAFYTEHERCGGWEGGVEDEWVFNLLAPHLD